MERICFKGDGTFVTGGKIIKRLIEMGGVNENSIEGSLSYGFYYNAGEIHGNLITVSGEVPPGYKQAFLEEEKLFSKSEMIQILKDYDESMTSLNVFIDSLEPESEYRTPDVTEFRVGFEFEFRNDAGKWIKHTMNSLDYRVSSTMNLARLQSIYPNRFRTLKTK